MRETARSFSDNQGNSRGNYNGDNLLGVYLNEIGKYRLLDRAEENYLGRRIAQGSRMAKKKLILSNLKLVVDVAKQYSNQGLSLLDLIQEGNVGLITAVKKFDHNKGYKFSTYATWWIRQRIRRAVINQGQTIRIPTHTYELVRKIKNLKKLYRIRGREQPPPSKIAEELDISINTVKRAERAAQPTLSLDQPISPEQEGVLGDFIPSQTPSPEQSAMRATLEEELKQALNRFPERKRHILELRYGLKDGQPHSLSQIGSVYEITRERVRQIEKEALNELQDQPVYYKLKRYREVLTGRT